MCGSLRGKFFSALNFTYRSISPNPSLSFKIITVNGALPFLSARQSDGHKFCLACRPILTLNWLDATPSPPVQYDTQRNIVELTLSIHFFASWEYFQYDIVLCLLCLFMPVLGPCQSPVHRVPEAVFLGGGGCSRVADHSPQPAAAFLSWCSFIAQVQLYLLPLPI
jgi:hypothetical protein